MAFAQPSVTFTVYSPVEGRATTHSYDYPATVPNGALILLYASSENTSTGIPSAPTGFTTLNTPAPSGQWRSYYGFKVADGTEGGGTVDLTWSGARYGVGAVIVITDWDGTDPTSSYFAVTGGYPGSGSATPASLTPPGGADDVLWLVVGSLINDGGTLSSPSSGFTTLGQDTTGVNGANDDVSVFVTTRELNASSITPGSLSFSESEAYNLITIAVYPGSEGSSGDITVDAEAASLALTAFSASLSTAVQIDANAASLALTPYQATVSAGAEMTAGADDFDSAIGTTSITDEFTSTPTGTITPWDGSEVTGWLTFATRWGGTDGKTPYFKTDYTNFRYSQRLPNCADWSGPTWQPKDETDPGTGRPRTWYEFDNSDGLGNSSPYVETWWNDDPFTVDDVEVALKPRWHYYDTQHAIAYAATSGYAIELQSSQDASGLPAHAHASVTESTDNYPNSVSPTTLNLYGILLDDTSSQPAGGKEKINVIAIVGQHSSECQGRMHGWEFLHYYEEGTGAIADAIRQNFRIFIYDANPAGSYYGQERKGEEPGAATDYDTNRQWLSGGGNSTQIDAVMDAIDTDLAAHGGSGAVVAFDFHGKADLNNPSGDSNVFGHYHNGTAADTDYRSRIATNLGTTFTNLGTHSSHGTGLAGYYFYNVLGAQLSITPENPIAAPGYPDMNAMYGDYAEAMWKTLDEMVTAGTLVLPTATINAAPASLTLTPNAATLGLGSTVNADTASLELTTSAATLAVGTSIDAKVQGITLTANAADLGVGTAISADVQSLTLTTYQGDLSVGTSIEAAVTGLTLTPNAANVQIGSAMVAALAELELTTSPASLSVGNTINASTAQMALETFSAGIELGITIQGSLYEIGLEALAASVGLGTNISAFAENLELTPHGATLTLGTGITAQRASLALSTYRASVDAGVVPITAPGLEYTLPVSRIHFTFIDEDA